MSRQVDSKDLTIGILSTTAMMLLVGLVVVQSRPSPVSAAGTAVSTPMGEYVLSVGTWSSDEDVVYVTDSAAERLIVYRFDSAVHQIDLVQGIDLAEMRRSAEASAAASSPPAP